MDGYELLTIIEYHIDSRKETWIEYSGREERSGMQGKWFTTTAKQRVGRENEGFE